MNFNLGAAPVAEQTKEDSLPDNRCWSFLEIQTAVGGTGKQKFKVLQTLKVKPFFEGVTTRIFNTKVISFIDECLMV